jgi:hypothetical protein
VRGDASCECVSIGSIELGVDSCEDENDLGKDHAI